MRPPGYEPGELPTAPLRDVNCTDVLSSVLRCKGSVFFSFPQTFMAFFLAVSNKKGNFAHDNTYVQYYVNIKDKTTAGRRGPTTFCKKWAGKYDNE